MIDNPDYCDVLLCDALIQLSQGVKVSDLKVRVSKKEAKTILKQQNKACDK